LLGGGCVLLGGVGPLIGVCCLLLGGGYLLICSRLLLSVGLLIGGVN
jgi:hypothetical protein